MRIGFLGIVVVLLALDLGILHRKQRDIGVRESLMRSPPPPHRKGPDMPYKRSLSRFSKRSWHDFSSDVHRARNEQLMEGIVAGCALVAYADGWVTDTERDRMSALIRGCEPIAAFGLAEVGQTFADYTQRFSDDFEAGERHALDAVARLKHVNRYNTLLVETCCAIADADGGFEEEERLAAIRICDALDLDPASFGLAEAP